MSECGKTFDFTRGDGHTIGSHWRACVRRDGHTGEHADWALYSDGQQAEDEAAARESGRRLMAFITKTASNYQRTQIAERLVREGLAAHPNEPFTITVPVAS